MDRKAFRKLTSSRVVLLDGATGTELARAGMPADACPEQWVLEHPDALQALQRAYVEAGSDILYSCTFGANRLRLERYGVQENVGEMNRALIEISRSVIGDRLLFGDIAPTGQFIAPLGEVSFEKAVKCYGEQVRGLLKGGVDGFVVETMVDVQEARAALLAIRSQCDLPVMISMTLDRAGRTLTGADFQTAVVTLQSMGADAVGCNCSTGPADIIHHLREGKPHATVPLMAKPNAGMPKGGEGWQLEFDIDAEEFASYVPEFVRRGVNLLGGCCGTTPEYIRLIKEKAAAREVIPPQCEGVSAITSSRGAVFLGSDRPLTIIGERINPTGKKKLLAELAKGELDLVRRYGIDQVERGAALLDVNMGHPSIDEKRMMRSAVGTLAELTGAPLSIDTTNPEVLEPALRLYPGRALVNSISAEKERLERNLPIAAKYGAMVIVLPMNDEGLPVTAKEQKQAAETVMQAAQDLDYHLPSLVLDGMMLAASADPLAAQRTLELIEWGTRDMGVNTMIGLSNVSFGLPGREWLNAGFLSMAIGRGLSLAIANPMDKLVMAAKYTGDALWGRDEYSMEYLRYYRAILQRHEVVHEGGDDGYEEMFPEEAPVGIEVHDNPEGIMEDALTRRMYPDGTAEE